jgi:hypothetical protein
MKIAIGMVALLLATTAFAQSGGGLLNSEPQRLEMTGHPAHASQVGMGTEQRVRETSYVTIEHGERPLWEVAPKVDLVPLGDTARRLRQEHATVKKAQRVWEN